jgi:hypothetical protein
MDLVRIDPEALRLPLHASALTSEMRTAMTEEALRRWLITQDRGPLARVENVELFVREGGSLTRQGASEFDFPHADDPTARHVSRCRQLLQFANFVLPPSVRKNALDEWMDEIQSAAEEGLPFRRRALSILFRSLPALALRARLPVRARRGEG